MSDELLKAADARPDSVRTHWETCYLVHDLCLIAKLAACVRELEADRDSWRDQADQRVTDWDEMRQRAERAEAENERLRDALDTLAKEEWRDDDDPLLDAARVKARAALAGEKHD